MTADDHDHSGDRLGEAAPVESITANSVSIRDFDAPNSYVVYEADGTWFALRTSDQTVEFADADAVTVINSALDRLGELDATAGGARGTVRVTANVDTPSITVESSNTIEHTTDGTELVFEKGVEFSYTGDDEAVILAGDDLGFQFYFLTSEGDYAVRDLGMSNSTVRGGTLRGAKEVLWLSDAANQVHVPSADAGRTRITIPWAVPDSKWSIELTSAPDASFTDYRFVGPIIVDGNEGGIIVGDESDAQTVNHNMFYVDVDAWNSSGRRFIVNDSHNVVYLKDYVPGSLTEPDVEIRPSAADTTVVPDCVRGWPAALVTQREAVTATDMSTFDPFRPEVLAYDVFPDSLAAYETVEREGGSVDLYSGYVEQRTGDEADGWANVRRHVSQNYGRLGFNINRGVLQTNVWLSDAAGQEAWLLWGDREGPGVGWHVVDDVLEGFVHDGTEITTVPLRTGFDAGVSWNLTALYNKEEGVQYWIQETDTAHVESGEPSESQSVVDASFDTDENIPVENLSFSVPDDDETVAAHQVVAIDLTTTEPAEKTIRWSNWRNYQYPLF
jgi:hypothetical protein